MRKCIIHAKNTSDLEVNTKRKKETQPDNDSDVTLNIINPSRAQLYKETFEKTPAKDFRQKFPIHM